MLIKQLQAACEVELFSQAEIAEVVRHMDIERDGHITFLEFVHAFGIGDNDDARDDDEVDGIDGAGSLVCLEMMQQICSSLFERSHALGKAFHYVDTSGRGYLPPDEFEKAVELVLTSDESHHCPGGGELTSSQVKHLVYSLRGSTLVDERRAAQRVHEVLHLRRGELAAAGAVVRLVGGEDELDRLLELVGRQVPPPARVDVVEGLAQRVAPLEETRADLLHHLEADERARAVDPVDLVVVARVVVVADPEGVDKLEEGDVPVALDVHVAHHLGDLRLREELDLARGLQLLDQHVAVVVSQEADVAAVCVEGGGAG